MGPSAIPNEIPVNTGYLMRICETLHSTPAIGRAIVIATTLSVCVCVCVRYMLLSSLVLYFDNAPSLMLASFICVKSTRPPGRPDRAGTPIERAGSRSTAQRTAQSPQPARLAHQCPQVAQTAIKRLQFNHCHLSHIKEDTGQPSVPVQEFNRIACLPSLPGM